MATLMPSSHSTTCKTHPPHHPIHKAPKDLLRRIAKSNPKSLQFQNPAPKLYIGGGGLRVDPTKLGGDPTGIKDSWEALDAAITVCLNQSSLSPNGYFPGQDTTPEFGPIGDMGGCEIDLGGGEFRISKPLVLPEMNANMQFGPYACLRHCLYLYWMNELLDYEYV